MHFYFTFRHCSANKALKAFSKLGKLNAIVLRFVGITLG